MISRMSTSEKITALNTATSGIDSLGLVGYNWWSEATHGISHVSNGPKTPYESNFAFPITTAMSFNRTLWKKTGAQIGREARAFMNQGDAWSTYWAPVINLAREPRWGRNIETPGEDPYLTGEYATSFVTGFEVSEDDPTHLQASACCKHYVANSMDHSTVAGETWDRTTFNANISMQDLVDSYMLPFQACVEKGHVSGLMCSYNEVNGVPSCANDWLLTTVARDAWGFDGYITSDCDADANVYNSHHYTATPEEAVRDVLRAGTDVDCTSFVGRHAQSALDKGLITTADLDARLAMLFRVRMRLQHFDPPGPLQQIPPSDVCSPYAQALARDGVAQGATLLKNDPLPTATTATTTTPVAAAAAAAAAAKRLPLNAKALKSVAVLGPNANLSKAIAGYYGGNSCDNAFLNMVDAIAQAGAFTTTTALGVPTVTSDDTSGVAAAAALAKAADVTVLVLGTDLSVAREGHDAVNISIPAGQLALVAAACEASSAPVVVATLTAVPLDLTPLLTNPKVGAIVHLGQPSVQTLGAADVLFGAKSPAGKTIQTIYPSSYQDEVSIFDFNMRPGPSAWPRPDCAPGTPAASCPRGTNPGRTYRFYTGTPVLPFGYGLSYTTFKYALAAPPRAVSLAPLRAVLRDATAQQRQQQQQQQQQQQRGGSKGSGPAFPPLKQVGAPATQYAVQVTNTGDVDADDVVLGFVTPPGAGKNGVPLKQLFGFERVHVKAGQTVTAHLYPSLMDFSVADVAGERSPLAGEYTISFGIERAARHGMGYVEAKLSAVDEPVVESAVV